jgi:preprotein translocase subunit SecE
MQAKSNKVVKYVKESYDELIHKVSWPTWAELQNSAVVVSVASLVIALIVFVMDFVFGIHHTAFGQFMWKGILGFLYGA